jgi:hypothetical protein
MTKVEALRQAQLILIRANINSDFLARRGNDEVEKLALFWLGEAKRRTILRASNPRSSARGFGESLRGYATEELLFVKERSRRSLNPWNRDAHVSA